jgi:hypothetical protein
MGVFGKIAGADKPSGKGLYFTRGDYAVDLLAVKLFESSKSGHDLFVVEAEIAEVLLEYPESRKVGERASWVLDLTKHPKMSAGDCKLFIATAAEIDFDEVTEAIVEKAVEDDGAVFEGMRLHAHVFDRPRKSGEGTFTVIQWSVPDDEDDSADIEV